MLEEMHPHLEEKHHCFALEKSRHPGENAWSTVPLKQRCACISHCVETCCANWLGTGSIRTTANGSLHRSVCRNVCLSIEAVAGCISEGFKMADGKGNCRRTATADAAHGALEALERSLQVVLKVAGVYVEDQGAAGRHAPVERLVDLESNSTGKPPDTQGVRRVRSLLQLTAEPCSAIL
jgi:hypothetical protein